MKLQVIIAVNRGLPEDDPIVTSSLEEAQERYAGLCEHYSLPPDDPHDDENDVWWWEVESAIRMTRTHQGTMQVIGIRSKGSNADAK